jgi:hypothetical protein
VLGNKTFNEGRYGAYTSIDLTKGIILQLGGGYADRLSGASFLGSNKNGGYGDVTLVFLR